MNTESKALPLAQKRIALGVTGGIAAYKSIEVLRALQQAGCEVRVAMTRHACEFIQPLTFRALSGSYVIVDDYAPENPDPIAHITFAQTIDLFVIAPATANILAKLANGIADDFLTSTYLACTAPVLIAPAMNTTMWQHPATQRNLQKLRDDGVRSIEPDQGEMWHDWPGKIERTGKNCLNSPRDFGPAKCPSNRGEGSDRRTHSDYRRRDPGTNRSGAFHLESLVGANGIRPR